MTTLAATPPSSAPASPRAPPPAPRGAADGRARMRAMRWIALALLVANAAFDPILDVAGAPLDTIEDVSRRYDSLFTPAAYAFAIWGLLYTAFIAHALHSVLPSQRKVRVHDRLAPWLIAYSVLGMAWTVVFRLGMAGSGAIIVLVMLAVGAIMFDLAHHAEHAGEFSAWSALRFSLFFGWISVAAIASISAWLASMHAYGPGVVEAHVTIALIGVALMAALVVSMQYEDAAYPLVVAWGMLAIWARQRGLENEVATVGLMAALVGFSWSVTLFLGRLLDAPTAPGRIAPYAHDAEETANRRHGVTCPPGGSSRR